ncbi:cell division protein ZapA [Paucibacter oligotrophus]|uniref:Cell division protein ZapA n=1 Tax=Roseateles oligotrophus TaxID=1769250 RepID=A0A840LE41_9BURK|nr:cell division protein ZapA [Roseateles oligotrophus]MBB4844902.1 cell division protein ZapA [Roseateles oligotrophus]
MKQMEVTIMGQSYLLGCPEGGEAALAEAVSQVDREMCAIRDGGKVKARERIAVLAALNLAYQLAEDGGTAAPAAQAEASAQAAAPDLGRLPDLDGLMRRLDEALEHDGHLL